MNNRAQDLVEAYQAMKARYGISGSYEWWEAHAGVREFNIYKIDTARKKLSMRSYDDTASVAIYDKLRYVDFGSDGESHDPVYRVMEVTSMPFLEAVEFVLELDQALPPEFIPTATSERTVEKKKPYTIKYIQNLIRERSKHKEIYAELATGLFRGCTKDEQTYGEKIFSIGLVLKNEYQNDDRIFIPEIDVKHVAVGSYRYNRTPGLHPSSGQAMNKGLLRKNGKRIIFGEHLISKFKKDVILAEGHSDCVVNNAKRMACVSSGSSTKKLGDRIFTLAGKHIHIFPDADFAGAEGAFKKALEIISWNKDCSPEDTIEFTIYWWSQTFTSAKINSKVVELGTGSDIDKSIPKNDPLRLLSIPCNNGTASVDLNLLRQFLVITAKKVGLKAFPKKLDPRNWIVLSKGPKKEGYDFVDFHEENMSNHKYQNFISKFQY